MLEQATNSAVHTVMVNTAAPSGARLMATRRPVVSSGHATYMSFLTALRSQAIFLGQPGSQFKVRVATLVAQLRFEAPAQRLRPCFFGGERYLMKWRPRSQSFVQLGGLRLSVARLGWQLKPALSKRQRQLYGAGSCSLGS